MSDKQSFRVTATPRERLQLAHLLFNPILKERTVRNGEAMYQARKHLGLLEVSELLLDTGVSDEMARDRHTRNVFQVTHADADYVLAAREKVELEPTTEHMLIPILLQLRAVKDSGIEAADADSALPYDEAAEAPRWKRSLRPTIKKPEQLITVLGDVLGEAARKEPALRELHTLFLAATAEPEKPEAQANGRADAAPAPPS